MIAPEKKALGITYAYNRNSFFRQGVDAKSSQEVGIVLSSEWIVRIDGNEIKTYSTPVGHGGPQSFAYIPWIGQNIQVEIEFQGPFRSVEILPKEEVQSLRFENNIARFKVEHPCNLFIEANGSARTPLALCIFTPEEIPDKNDANVLWFQPGIHELDFIELEDNQVLYLEEGAILRATNPKDGDPYLEDCDWAGKRNFLDFIFANGKRNIKVYGNGIIDTTGLDWHARRTMVFSDCYNISISGVILVGASHWTLPCFGCENVTIQNVTILGYRENSDGINLVDSKNVTVNGCFIRTGDDAICVKSMGRNLRKGSENIHVSHCLIWNDKVRALGIAGETRFDIHNIIFEHCYIAGSIADWTREVGALCIVISDSATMQDITFRNIQIRYESNYVINCMIMQDFWSTDKEAGHIKDINFENITIPADGMIYLEGYDENHRIENIIFDKIRLLDEEENIAINQYITCNEFATWNDGNGK